MRSTGLWLLGEKTSSSTSPMSSSMPSSTGW